MPLLPEILIGFNGSKTLIRKDLDETYHSQQGAIQESRHVYIEAGLKHYLSIHPNTKLHILEIGFGSGLNAMLTLLEAEELQLPIHYAALETVPLPYSLIQQLDFDKHWGQKKNKLFQDIHAADWENEISITKDFHLQKIQQSLQDYAASDTFDLVYFDAFAPDKQAELWQADMLRKIYSCMSPSGTFVTYSSKGEVRRSLQSAGFHVEKMAGALGKRHMLRATKNENHE